MKGYRDRFHRDRPIITDAEALERDLSGNSIIVFGTPTGNLWLAKHLTELPIQITPTQILADDAHSGTNLRLITAWPNPTNPERGVLIYTAQQPEDVVDINGVFHGPTDYVVARGTEVLCAADYSKEKRPWTLGRKRGVTGATRAGAYRDGPG